MVSVEQAEAILHMHSPSPRAQQVSLSRSLNRILAETVSAPSDMPPFSKSAMDGYACCGPLELKEFRIMETVAAGASHPRRLHAGECAKIMTGAMLPPGSDRVIRKELARETDGRLRVTGEEQGLNILIQGEDFRKGDRILEAGTLIRPAEIALLASLGQARVRVFVRPRVAIITTGSELVEVGKRLARGQIFNSNAPALAAQIEALGAEARPHGTVADSPAAIRTAVVRALTGADVLILSGGVSAGDFDFVPDVLRQLGVQLHFEKVAVQPGMPTVFGTKKQKAFFGLPGNPVSTFVIFEVFIKPFLYRRMGYAFRPLSAAGTFKTGFRRKRAERTLFLPVRFQAGEVEAVIYHGSGHLQALSRANALLTVPSGTEEILAGSRVDVRLL